MKLILSNLLLLGLFFAVTATSSSVLAKSSDVCEPCSKAIALESKIAASKILPDQMNEKTLGQQELFVGDSAEAMLALLKVRPFKQEHARALLKLLSRIACFYDNQGDLPGLNRDQFKAIYDTRSNVLRSEIQTMIKSGEITEKRSKAMLEAIGAIPANDYIPAGCVGYK